MIQVDQILTGAEKFEIITKNSAEGIIIVNETGSIEEWNDYMVDKTRLPKSEISGKKIWDVQYGIMTKGWQKTYPLESLKKIWLGFIHDLNDNEYITKEGQFLTWNKEIILTEDIICRINFREKNYLYVIQRNRGTRRKIEYEDVMISIVSFKLKSLISSWQDFSELFNKESRRLNIDKLLNFIKYVISSSEHTIKLLENLLIFLSVQKGNLEFNPVKTNLNQIIDGIVQEFQFRAIRKNIIINYHPTAEILCTADINMLQIILRNLVDNALKFTHEKGNVDISASVKQDFVEIMVSDNGIGIDHESMKKLFLSGSNVSTPGTSGEEGTGLGLILSRNLVEKQGGKIWAESAFNKSSTFIFTIPVA